MPEYDPLPVFIIFQMPLRFKKSSFWKDYKGKEIFGKDKLYKQQKCISEYFSHTIDLFRKPISIQRKDFGKPLITWRIYVFGNRYLTIAAVF
jgi:hypothetical protein